MMNGLQPPQPLDLSAGSNIATNWKKFKKAWTNYEIATGMNEKSSKVRLATFLHVIGDTGVEKFESFNIQLEDEEENENFDVIEAVMKRFDDDCMPKTNILNERYKFLKRKQNVNENIDQYVTQLKILIASCEYANNDEAIRDQVILNMKDEGAREKILDKVQFEGKVPDLMQIVNMIKNYESRKIQQQNWKELNNENQENSRRYKCFKKA